MTTLKELGEMLIEVADNGRELQRNEVESWRDVDLEAYNINVHREYRLKPKVTYYRAYKHRGLETLDSASTPFPSVNSWLHDLDSHDLEHIHDFEVES